MLPFPQFPTRRFSQRAGTTIAALNRLGAAEWVLSRSLYRFSQFDLKNVVKAQRPQALRIQIRQWSPFANTGQCIIWGQDNALVWAWDADRLEQDLAAQKLKSGSTRIIPESLLHPPMSSGLRLIACLDGVEGQNWETNRLVHSRWWAEPPSPTAWLNFQRDAGIATENGKSVPAVQVPHLLKKPWANTIDLSLGGGQSLPYEARLLTGSAMLLAALTIWAGIEQIKSRQATVALKAQLADLAQAAQPILESRRKALDALARIESLQAANAYPPQLALLAEIATILPKDGTYLSEWDFQNGKLKITVASPNKLSSSLLVKKLQEIGWFRNVQAGTSSDSNTLTLNMETLTQKEIVPSTRDPAAQTAADKMGKVVEPAQLSPES